MKVNTVSVINDCLVLITKEGYRTVLQRYNDYVIVFKPDVMFNDAPFIPYCGKYTCISIDSIYNRWLFELCNQPVDSNYFATNNFEFHICNGGKFDDEEKAEITNIVLKTCEEYKLLKERT